MNFGTKIIIIVAISFVISYIINMVFIVRQIEADAEDSLVKQARSLTLYSENARRYIAEMNTTYDVFDDAVASNALAALQGVRDPEKRLSIIRGSAFYRTVPIVASWLIAAEKASNMGYEFRIAKRNARDPKNEADAYEREMLEEMEREGKADVWRFDHSINALRYMRGITLSKDCLSCHGTKKDDPDGDGLDPLGYTMEGWKEGEVHGGFQMLMDLSAMHASTRGSIIRTVLLGTAIVFIVIIIMYLLVNALAVRPVRSLRKAIGRIEEGDLTVVLSPKNQDDIGKTILSMNGMVDHLKTMINHIKGSIANSKEQSETLSANMEESAATINEIVANIKSVEENVTRQYEQVSQTEELNSKQNASVDGISGEIASVLNKTRDLESMIRHQASSVEQIATAIQEMSATIQNVSNVTQKADESTQAVTKAASKSKAVITTTTGNMQRVLESIKTINGFVSIISNIADQTNLLAMNAAIEAAHAGDVGRGFAVVAEEIRKLAEISNTQAVNATKSLKEIDEHINETAKNLGQTEDSFNILASEFESVSNIIAQVRHSAEEQTLASSEIVNAVTEVSGVTQNVKANYGDINNALDHMQGNVDILKDVSKRTISSVDALKQISEEITQSMAEMGIGAGELNVVTQNIVGLTLKTSEGIKLLENEINSFNTDNASDGRRSTPSNRHTSPSMNVPSLERKKRTVEKLIEWTDELSVAVDVFDKEHMKLVDLVNRMHEAMMTGEGKDVIMGVLQDLITYTAEHFKHEEKLMREHNYPGYNVHKQQHETLVQRVLELQKQYKDGTLMLSVEVFNFLRDWLEKHILGSDRKYGPFFNDKGVR